MNNKFNKSQLLLLSLVAALLFITPLLSSSLRPTYLYFIINLLIITLSAEAGLFSVFSKPPEEKIKKYSSSSSLSVSTKPVMVTQESTSHEANNNNKKVVISASPLSDQKKVTRVVEKSASEKIASGVVNKVVDKVKKCPSMPSLFFIGGGETELPEDQEVDLVHEDDDDQYEAATAEEEVLADKVLSGQELFTKAENFIGNFYKQLKMQREDSWKRIHGFYQKAF
ncbi:hypothetical protein LWI28_003839 [Acer negundo]|uniref:DUF4408 domain-containing protein n=1 Tax=Acer negundo TaxID=4023 RepID=A0AAD5J3Z3_ACENE|nr:hypothetical protein LWI28_003839 [Acer negundo]KAK4851539.1 hypothetical protein QYF36_016113 [Acer negundo]